MAFAICWPTPMTQPCPASLVVFALVDCGTGSQRSDAMLDARPEALVACGIELCSKGKGCCTITSTRRFRESCGGHVRTRRMAAHTDPIGAVKIRRKAPVCAEGTTTASSCPRRVAAVSVETAKCALASVRQSTVASSESAIPLTEGLPAREGAATIPSRLAPYQRDVEPAPL